jgi:hypothetical protein
MEWIKRFKPGIHKNWLQLISGLMWTGVGYYLIYLAVGWIFSPAESAPWIYWVPGCLLALAIYQFGFSKLAVKNSNRIETISDERPSIFAFQEWKSYFIIIFMIGLGITLRKYTPIPKPLLGTLYLGIGGGIDFSSSIYYIYLWNHRNELFLTRN